MFREILKNKIKTFNGHFDVGCQEASVTPVMQSFIPTFMHGSSAEIMNEYYKHAALTVGQMITFNTTIHTRKMSTILYHSVQREPPLPVYLMIMIYNKTRKVITLGPLHFKVPSFQHLSEFGQLSAVN